MLLGKNLYHCNYRTHCIDVAGHREIIDWKGQLAFCNRFPSFVAGASFLTSRTSIVEILELVGNWSNNFPAEFKKHKKFKNTLRGDIHICEHWKKERKNKRLSILGIKIDTIDEWMLKEQIKTFLKL